MVLESTIEQERGNTIFLKGELVNCFFLEKRDKFEIDVVKLRVAGEM